MINLIIPGVPDELPNDEEKQNGDIKNGFIKREPLNVSEERELRQYDDRVLWVDYPTIPERDSHLPDKTNSIID